MRKTRIVQIARAGAQMALIGLFFAGFYRELRFYLLILFFGSFIFGNFFCGWFCPFGAVQELFSRIGERLIKRKLKMPRRAQFYLRFLRYFLYGVSLTGFTSVVLDFINGYVTFLSTFSLNNIINLTLSATLIFTLFLILLSLFFDRFYCNYLCHEGARYGAASLIRLFAIQRDSEQRVSCGKCDKECPMNIAVSQSGHARSAQCVNCFRRIKSCPLPRTLRYGFYLPKIKRKAE